MERRSKKLRSTVEFTVSSSVNKSEDQSIHLLMLSITYDADPTSGYIVESCCLFSRGEYLSVVNTDDSFRQTARELFDDRLVTLLAIEVVFFSSIRAKQPLSRQGVFVTNSAFSSVCLVEKIYADRTEVRDVERLSFIEFFSCFKLFDDINIWKYSTRQKSTNPGMTPVFRWINEVLVASSKTNTCLSDVSDFITSRIRQDINSVELSHEITSYMNQRNLYKGADDGR